MLSNKEYQILAVVIFAFALYYFLYKRNETFGTDVGVSPFFPFRKVQSKYFWDHGCYGRDYQCYDRGTCAYGNCNKSCFGVCRNKFLKNGEKKYYYTNCYDKKIEHMTNDSVPMSDGGQPTVMEPDCTTCECGVSNCTYPTCDKCLTRSPTTTESPTPPSPTDSVISTDQQQVVESFGNTGDAFYLYDMDKQTRMQKAIGYDGSDGYINCDGDDCCSDQPDQCCHKYRNQKYCGLCARFPKQMKPKKEKFGNHKTSKKCGKTRCDDIVCTSFGGRCINNKCLITDKIDL